MRAADTAATGQACVDTSPPACEPPDFWIAAASCEIAVESAPEIALACALSDCCSIAAAGSSFARWLALAICCREQPLDQRLQLADRRVVRRRARCAERSPVAPVDAFVPEVAVVLAAPEVRVAPSVDDVAAAPDEAFAFRLPPPAASVGRGEIDLHRVGPYVGKRIVTGMKLPSRMFTAFVTRNLSIGDGLI